MKVFKGTITNPKGFIANGLSCGIKGSGKLDLSLIVSKRPAAGAAVFTKNSIKAAPVIVSQKHVRDGKVQAFIVNSGNANCFTGKFGHVYAEQTAELFSQLLSISRGDVIVSSTGIIGKPLPFKKIKAKAKALVKGLNVNNGHKASLGILTTDTKSKEAAVKCHIGGKTITVAGCAKGSGMVDPNMATMLGFITTDANINAKMLKRSLKQAVEKSFNCITIDGCMSTNDMVAVMANGLAQNRKITKQGKDYDAFTEALNYVCLELAKKIVLDAEGATKFVEIKVKNAKTAEQAKRIGLAVGNSVLVKTAAYGNNPNWGRVAQAVGALGIKAIDEHNLKIDFSSFVKKHIVINIDVGLGKMDATVYTSDLSHEYVRINTEYN